MKPAMESNALASPDAWRRLAPWILAVAGAIAYSNSFGGDFIYDDVDSIPMNESIRSLWPPWGPLRTPKVATVAGRPIVNLSFAISYAIHGADKRGYHAGNLLIHIGAAWLLYGIARRTLQRTSLSARLAGRSASVALAIALVWLLHPIHTASVTYMVQRAESLTGFLYLLALYLFIRAAESPRPRRWLAGSVAACALGMGCKEIMITAPFIILLYDRCYVSGDHLAALRNRRFYYAALAATAPIVAYGLLIDARDTELVLRARSPLAYMLNESRVILIYLRLILWPSGLALDYWLEFAKAPRELAVPIAATLALLALGAWAYCRRPHWGFLGAWFFVVLAPTASIAPLYDLIFVHRIYLSSAAAIALGVVVAALAMDKSLAALSGASRARRWIPIGMAALVAVALALATIGRNLAFRTSRTIWTDVVLKRPFNPRGYGNLGVTYQERGDFDTAERLHLRALELNPEYPETIYNLGQIAELRGDLAAALVHYDAALRLAPTAALFYYIRANLLAKLGRTEEAAAGYAETIRLKPAHAEARNNLGMTLADMGRSEEALAQLREAIRLAPDYADAENNLGTLLAEAGRIDEAIQHFRKAAELNPKLASARRNLGTALAEKGDAAGAIEQFALAIEIDPKDAVSRERLERLRIAKPGAGPATETP